MFRWVLSLVINIVIRDIEERRMEKIRRLCAIEVEVRVVLFYRIRGVIRVWRR